MAQKCRKATRHLMHYEFAVFRKQREGLYPDIKKRVNYHVLSDFKPDIDSQGNKLCVNCQKIVPKGRKKYCGSECSREFFRKHSWASMRAYILQKQNWTCQMCGAIPPRDEYGYFKGTDGLPESWWFYVVDHKKPIALGGGEFDENNLQVLCGICNKVKTKSDQAKIAKKRREIQVVINPFEISVASVETLRFMSYRSLLDFASVGDTGMVGS